MFFDNDINKDTIDKYLNELAEEYIKITGGEKKAEIIIVKR